MKMMMLLTLTTLVFALAGCRSYRGGTDPLDDVNYDHYDSRPAATRPMDSDAPRREFPSYAVPEEQPR